jgi:hypothetical protein
MATGNIKWFADGLLAIGNKQISLSADTFNIGIVTTATVPTIGTAVPHWGGTGTTNFATNQVSTAGGYTGPFALTGVTFANVANVLTFRANDPVIPANASGFANGAWGIIYSNTDANKRAIGYIELSAAGAASIVSGSLTIDFGGAGTDVLTITPT